MVLKHLSSLLGHRSGVDALGEVGEDAERVGLHPGQTQERARARAQRSSHEQQLGSPVALGSVEGSLGVVDNRGPRNGKKTGQYS